MKEPLKDFLISYSNHNKIEPWKLTEKFWHCSKIKSASLYQWLEKFNNGNTTQTEVNQMCLIITPHMSVYQQQTKTKDEHVGIGSYRVMRRGVIQLSLSEYYLLKSAICVVEAEILDKLFLYGKKYHPSTFPTRSPHAQ